MRSSQRIIFNHWILAITIAITITITITITTTITITIILVNIGLAEVPAPGHAIITDSHVRLDAFARVRADLDGKDVVFSWSGSIYSFVPEKPGQLLFKCEGFNISRIIRRPDGWMLFSREVLFYLDKTTGKPLERWKNPFTGKEVEVIHSWNDPVNLPLRYDFDYSSEKSPIKMEVTDMGDTLVWNVDVLLLYPSPLKRSEYPEYSAGDLYQGYEMFQFYSPKTAILDSEVKSAPAVISWTRLGQWLPFMEMSDRPGYLLYHCRGRKLPGGFDSLPPNIKDLVAQKAPQYKTSPGVESEKLKNETSWTYFKKLLDKRKHHQETTGH